MSQNERNTDSILKMLDTERQSWGNAPGFLDACCPVCRDSYVSCGTGEMIAGQDSYQAGWGGRGNLLRIPFSGECGHSWNLCFGFHKGETAIFIEINPGIDPSGSKADEGIFK